MEKERNNYENTKSTKGKKTRDAQQKSDRSAQNKAHKNEEF